MKKNTVVVHRPPRSPAAPPLIDRKPPTVIGLDGKPNEDGDGDGDGDGDEDVENEREF